MLTSDGDVYKDDLCQPQGHSNNGACDEGYCDGTISGKFSGAAGAALQEWSATNDMLQLFHNRPDNIAKDMHANASSVLKGTDQWRALRESNPSLQRERLTS